MHPSLSSSFFRLLLSNCLSWKINCDDQPPLSSTTAVQIWIISYILHIISLLTGRYELNELTSLPMCGFIAQLVEHRTGIAEVTYGFESRWSPDFFRLLLSNCLSWKICCDDHSSLSRLIMFAEYKEHTTPLFIRLSMLELDDINLQVTALFMFRLYLLSNAEL